MYMDFLPSQEQKYTRLEKNDHDFQLQNEYMTVVKKLKRKFTFYDK